MDVTPLFVVLMGMGVTFVGLTCLIILISAMGGICQSAQKKAPAVAPTAVEEDEPIADRGALIAAVSAAIAEDMGTDVSALRIVSMKRVA